MTSEAVWAVNDTMNSFVVLYSPLDEEMEELLYKQPTLF